MATNTPVAINNGSDLKRQVEFLNLKSFHQYGVKIAGVTSITGVDSRLVLAKTNESG